jgi:hypothetical protein
VLGRPIKERRFELEAALGLRDGMISRPARTTTPS